MNKKGRAVQKVVGILTDPEPQLVSLVGHGANQTPFSTVKSVADFRNTEEGSNMSNGNTGRQRTRTRTRTTKAAATPTKTMKASIQRVEFDSDSFDSEQAVKSYMENNGYSDFTVEALDDGYVVVAEDEGSFPNGVSPIESDKGVTMFLGGIQGDAEQAQKSAPAKKSTKASRDEEQAVKELTQKFDNFMAMIISEDNDTRTLSEVIQNGNDGIPVGMYEVNFAFYTALQNLVLAGDIQGIRTLAGEYGEAIVRLTTLFDTEQVSRSDRETVMAAQPPEKDGQHMSTQKTDTQGTGKQGAQKNADPAGTSGEATTTEDTTQTERGTTASENTGTADNGEGNTGKPEGSEGAEAGTDAGAGEGEGKDTTQKSSSDNLLEQVLLSVKSLADTTAEANKQSDDRMTRMEEAQKSLNERIEEMSGQTQARKSADVEETDASGYNSGEKEKAEKADFGFARNVLGFAGGNR